MLSHALVEQIVVDVAGRGRTAGGATWQMEGGRIWTAVGSRRVVKRLRLLGLQIHVRVDNYRG